MSGNLKDKARYARFVLGSLGFLGLVFSPCSRNLPGAAAPAAQSNRAFSMRVEVELVTAEVIVLDKKGKPVRNLKKENFRLYEDGKQQEIASFDEVNDESGQRLAASLADANGDIRKGKTVLILFDDSTIAPAHLKSTRDAAERFVREHMRAQDVFAVASYNLSLKVLQNFTDDPEKIVAAIRLPAVSGVKGTQEFGEEQFPQASKRNSGVFPQFNPAMKYQADAFFHALNYLNMSVERMRGRKSVLLFSEDLSLSEDSHSLFVDAVNSARKSNAVFYTIDARGLNWNPSGEIRSIEKDAQAYRPAKSSSGALASFKSVLLGQLPAALGGSTLLRNAMFQQGGGGGSGGGTGGGSGGGGTGGGGGSGGGSGSGAGGSTGGGTRGGAGSGNTGAGYPGTSTSPGYNSNSSNPYGSTGMNTMGPDFRQNSSRMEQNILRSLANETGGSAIYNTSDFNGALDLLDQQLSNYYILGFQSSNPKRDGSFRKLEVKTDLKGVSLRFRKGYVDRRPLDTLVNSKQEKSLLNALDSPTVATQLPLVFRAVYFYDSPRLARVLVSARIDFEKAELRKKGGQKTCDLDVMGVAYAENDTVAARFSETVHVAIDKEKEQDVRKSLVYKNYFKLRPGKYRLKIAASDGANNLGSMERQLEIPALPEHGIAGSSLIVAERVSQLPDLIRNLETKLLDDSDPMIYAGLQISPSIENRLPANSPVPVFFKLYNTASESAHWEAVAKAKLMRDTGEELSLAPFSLEEETSQDAEATIGLSLPFKDVVPGKYKLVIETTEVASSRTAVVQTDLEFVKN